VERNSWVRAVLVLLAIIGTLWLLGWLWDLAGRFADIILPFFLAWLLAFVLYPAAAALTKVDLPWFRGRANLPHWFAVTIVYGTLILLLTLTSLLLAPIIVSQAAQLGASLPLYVSQLPSLTDLQAELTRRGIPVDLQAMYQQQTILDQAGVWGGELAKNALGIATGIAMVAFNLLIVLVISFYMMLDGPRIARDLLELVPAQYQNEATFFMSSITRTFGGFIRGQLLQAAVYGAGTAVVMAVAGLQYIAVVSSFSALATIIPFIGPLIALALPLALAAVQAPSTFVGVLIALFVLQQIVNNIIAPKVMSEAIGLHPILVLLATMIGVKVGGFWGALFGVPVVGVLYATLDYVYLRRFPQRQTQRKKPRRGAEAPSG